LIQQLCPPKEEGSLGGCLLPFNPEPVTAAMGWAEKGFPFSSVTPHFLAILGFNLHLASLD
jgi:hypothetical protein